jgi:tetratricopeptide (TPR) repeat protein
MYAAHAGSRRWRFIAFSTAVGLTVGGSLAGAGSAQASSHREAPLTAGDPKIDNTDLYAFTSPDKTSTVTLIANWLPFEEPSGGPNFYPWQDGAHYDINIDNDGDAKADITYRWVFSTEDDRAGNTFLYNNGPVTSLTDENLLFKQTYKLSKIVNGDEDGATTIASGTAAPSNTGSAGMPNYGKLRTASFATVDGGGKSFAGQADDPFFLDLRVFDLLYGGNLSKVGRDTLKGYNVNSIALQVPKSEVAQAQNATKNPVIGIWSSTAKQTMTLTPGAAEGTGEFVQVSRLGNPLVNEVVVPASLKDAFNSITPDVDHTVDAVVDRVLKPELPALVEAIYGIKAPTQPRNDLFEIFLTGIAKNAPSSAPGVKAPIQADLNSQILNQDVDATKFVPSEMLRLNMGVAVTTAPNRLGVLAADFQGFPNGRRLMDDVLDIAVQAVEGAAQTGKIVAPLAAGDKVNNNDRKFGTMFPYLALPNTRPVNETWGSAAPVGMGGDNRGGGGWTSHLALDPGVLRVGSLALAMLLLGAGGLGVLRSRRLRPGLQTASSVRTRWWCRRRLDVGGTTTNSVKGIEMSRGIAAPIALTAAGIALLAVVLGSFSAPVPAAPSTSQVGSQTAPEHDPDVLSASIAKAQARLRDFPADQTTWAGLGSAYVQQARVTGDPTYYPKAEGALRRSLALNPMSNWQAMAGLGALANARHDFAEALGWARKAALINSFDATIYGVTDDALTQLGDYPAAARAAQKMLDLQPGVPAFTRASYHFEVGGDIAKARWALNQALSQANAPSDIAYCRYYLGELAFNEGDPRAALHQYELGLTADPGADALLAGRAKAEAALGRWTAAVHDYASVIARVPQAQYVLENAELLISLGHDATEQFTLLSAEQKLLAANGVVDDLMTATVEADHGSATVAVRHAEAEWRRRKSVIVADALGWALHRAGRDREALHYALRANQLDWRNAGFRFHLGMIELSLGRRAEAHRHLSTALKINPYFSVLQAPVARRALITSAVAR